MSQKYAMLVMTDAVSNNNKYYELKMEEDGSVVARYGRVGNAGVTESKGSGEAIFEKVLKSKTKKGYRPVDVATDIDGKPPATVTGSVKEIAHRDVAANDPTLTKLIDRLLEANRHQLFEATGGKITISGNSVRTELGVPLTLAAVQSGKDKLVKLQQFVEAGDLGTGYVHDLQDYLTAIPQKIPLKRGWHETFFSDFTSFQSQYALLDQLEGSIRNYKAPEPGEEVKQQRLFGYSLKKVEESDVFHRIRKFYESQVNRQHACAHLKLKNVFALSNADKLVRYEEKAKNLGNVKQLWHGTRAHNVLSILKGGLIIPTSTGSYTITGRMFGDGVYFSDQSSKSLNYAYGYWDRGSRDNNCFMFLADVVMGREYTPRRPEQRIPSGYDSMFAKGGHSGVQNNEMIVYNLDQAHLTFLCEFDSK